MQKAANDHIGPKLDLLVKTNQEKVLRRREEAERALLQRKEEFREEMQHTFEGEVQALRDVSALLITPSLAYSPPHVTHWCL